MNVTQEVREQYKRVAREYFREDTSKTYRRSVAFNEGIMTGLSIALSCLGVTNDEVREMYKACEEEVKDELEREKRAVATASSLIFSPEFLKRRDKEQETGQ